MKLQRTEPVAYAVYATAVVKVNYRYTEQSDSFSRHSQIPGHPEKEELVYNTKE